jgi:hypothetical protein
MDACQKSRLLRTSHLLEMPVRAQELNSFAF